jgi:hypothetical protein
MAVHESEESQDDEFSSKIRPIHKNHGSIYNIHWHRVILGKAGKIDMKMKPIPFAIGRQRLPRDVTY